MKKHSLVVEEDACWGCRTCEVACKQEHDHTEKFVYVTEDGPKKIGDKLQFVYQVNLCRHCDAPPCVEACPEDAIEKREDGIVIMNQERCSGCQACMEACPYGVIGFDESAEKAFKCNMCPQRVDRGLIPACADNVCPAHCIYFGDPDEISAQIQAKRNKRKTI